MKDTLLGILGCLIALFTIWFIPTLLGLTGATKIVAYIFELWIFKMMIGADKKEDDDK